MWVRKDRERNFKPFPNECSIVQKKARNSEVVSFQQKVLRFSSTKFEILVQVFFQQTTQ